MAGPWKVNLQTTSTTTTSFSGGGKKKWPLVLRGLAPNLGSIYWASSNSWMHKVVPTFCIHSWVLKPGPLQVQCMELHFDQPAQPLNIQNCLQRTERIRERWGECIKTERGCLSQINCSIKENWQWNKLTVGSTVSLFHLRRSWLRNHFNCNGKTGNFSSLKKTATDGWLKGTSPTDHIKMNFSHFNQ